MKYIFDKLFSFFLIILLMPFLILIAIIIKCSNFKEPIFFLQNRIGQHGKPFTMIKFRTMHSGILHSTITIRGDKRITALGKTLRKYKLDELPELFNILIGDMSFVGPRPDTKRYADMLVGESKNILLLKPGLTGPATLKYANEEVLLSKVKDPYDYYDNIIFPDKVKINLRYYYNNSFKTDLIIIFKTIFRINYE